MKNQVYPLNWRLDWYQSQNKAVEKRDISTSTVDRILSSTP
jgi:hypothetical protein